MECNTANSLRWISDLGQRYTLLLHSCLLCVNTTLLEGRALVLGIHRRWVPMLSTAQASSLQMACRALVRPQSISTAESIRHQSRCLIRILAKLALQEAAFRSGRGTARGRNDCTSEGSCEWHGRRCLGLCHAQRRTAILGQRPCTPYPEKDIGPIKGFEKRHTTCLNATKPTQHL